MKTTASEHAVDKKGHVCPPSNATHPRDRWESLFVYSFICKFTSLRGRIEGLDSPMDFEEALLSPEPNPIMTAILSRFVLNLRPLTRNLSTDVISSTVASVLQDYLKSSERSVFWDDEIKTNVDPFQGMENGFFTAEWTLKLKILRQLVELQLCHSAEIKAIIDRAWGVIHNKHKKIEITQLPPPPGDPQSQERLQLTPLGQDKDRKRYWVIDDSPRLYMSTNPWKITATFQAVSSTRDEYVALVQRVDEAAPPELKAGERRAKLELAHLALLKSLRDRLECIDTELARVQRAKRKIEQRNLLIAQAEVRETRTRRRTSRPDYAYLHDPTTEDDQDEYTYQEQPDEEYDDEAEYDDIDSFHGEGPSASSRPPTRRRSTRASHASSNGRRAADGGLDEWAEWRGERRSTRLGGVAEVQPDGGRSSRARTEDSSTSNHSTDGPVPIPSANNGLKVKVYGAAAIKPTETAVEAVAGKKKSKFWYYAVEPVGVSQDQEHPPPSDGNSVTSSTVDSSRGSELHNDRGQFEGRYTNQRTSYRRRSVDGTLSATSDMDVS